MGPRSYERGIAPPAQSGSRQPLASMGPRSYERGIKMIDGLRCASHLRFNGAAFLRTRNRGGSGGSVAPKKASMGPRSYERGIRDI